MTEAVARHTLGVTEGFLDLPGIRQYYIDLNLLGEWDQPAGDPVILLHGLGCDWRVWRRQIGWLSHARRVVALDSRGSGQSRWNQPGWTTADMAADVHRLVRALDLRRPAIVGISMGGTVALQYALDHPDGISNLVLLGTFAGIPPEAAELRDGQLRFIETHTLPEIAATRIDAGISATADPRLKAWLVDMLSQGDIDGYRSQARTTLTFDVTDRLADISTPTTVLHGTQDRATPYFLGQMIAAGIPSCDLHLIEGQGHFVNLEAPQVLNPLLAHALDMPEHPGPS